jgi:hypothetical protein
LVLSTTSDESGALAADTPAVLPALSPLEQLLAPIALYPDPLLAQVLTSATSPGQVTEMTKWVQQNPKLQGSELQEAAQRKGFDASFVALVLFPDVLARMASEIDWTTEVGTAFLSDPKGVMNAVQSLRAQALTRRQFEVLTRAISHDRKSEWPANHRHPARQPASGLRARL